MVDRFLTIGTYVLLGGVLVAAAVVALVRPGMLSRPGQVVTWALRRRTTQLGLLLAWWWLGWHFVTLR